ncbi:vanillate O-demethylase ferredoxin subunit [Rhizobium sp. BK529]|uniref:PDR/VanB family oxidoreductase n=1 Tax=Rhizobium sp. BK529 TaxID=2586983 RepID=UPI0017EA1AA9|nr:PDR/VanB family oxidoreductase [Rhizobium sp. BK529]MBB3594885.1 vanillate O-demethylase ferredoxin subunit [Rhizobium sp. BK529]
MAEPTALRLRILAIRYEAEAIRSFELVSPDGGLLPSFKPGAHIDLALPGDLWRSYSLTSDGDRPRSYIIAVNRDASSRGGSAYLCETARVGDVVTVQPPRNNFVLNEEADHSVFFAGGIGITPVVSMIRRMEALSKSWKLIYAGRSRPSAAFVEELERLETIQPGRVLFHFDDEKGSVLPIADLVAASAGDAHLYCCGPAPMIDAFKNAAATRRDETVHVEHFSATVEQSTTSFVVVLKRSGKEFLIPAGRTIMDVLQEAGIRVAYSCREGVCGTCETRVVEGVPDHKDNVLSAREQASNKLIMICCSGAKSDRLVLDL